MKTWLKQTLTEIRLISRSVNKSLFQKFSIRILGDTCALTQQIGNNLYIKLVLKGSIILPQSTSLKLRFVETMKRFVAHFQKFRRIQNSSAC